jgi:hypothetical protein
VQRLFIIVVGGRILFYTSQELRGACFRTAQALLTLLTEQVIGDLFVVILLFAEVCKAPASLKVGHVSFVRELWPVVAIVQVSLVLAKFANSDRHIYLAGWRIPLQNEPVVARPP